MNDCPAEITLNALSGKWKIFILIQLISGAKRFNQLQREIKNISQKVLTQQLRELEAMGIIERKIYPEIPPKVEYFLTPVGESLEPIIVQMHRWGSNFPFPDNISDDF